jgi:predicted SprT family Zn-dependent metalloprotease
MKQDRTAELLQQFQDAGLRTIATGQLLDPPLDLHFYVTLAAETLIEQKKFLVPDEDFSLDRLHTWLLPIYRKALQYLQCLAPELGLHALHVVIDDLGDNRDGTASSAKHHSTVIIHDILRWHKMYKRQWCDFAPMLVLHELVHLATYRLCPKQNKYHRELTAVVIERIFHQFNQYHPLGHDAAAQRYLRHAGKLDSLDAVLATSYSTNTSLRYIVDHLLCKVQDGTYRGGVRPNPKEVHSIMKNFAKTYLRAEETGDVGFNTACRESGITSSDGSPLTLEALQRECHAELVTAGKAGK